MVREILILLSCGSVGYAWLCAVTAPLVHAIRSVLARGASLRFEQESRNALLALALAAGAALLWTAILAAAILLSMMLEPRAGLALLGSHLFWPGIAGGALVWCGQLLATLRVPRFSDDVEAAAALAIVALVDDDPETLMRAHRLYASYAIGPRDPRRFRLGGSRPAAAA
jgi:hypothetical protein